MFGRRLSKTVDGDSTYFVYDRDNVILDFVDDGSDVVIDQRYLHGARVDQVLAQESVVGDVFWHLSDHLGSIRDLVDNTGNTVNHYVYDSFGNVVSMTGETVESRYLYTGREWDDEIGLQFNRGRYYKPKLGIFINEDPIGFEGGDSNLYRYVKNNSINFVDSNGLSMAGVLTLGGFAAAADGPIPVGDLIGLGIIIVGGTVYLIKNLQEEKEKDCLAPPGDCTSGVHRRLQDEVDNKCKSGIGCKGTDTKETLREKIIKHQQCISARNKINNKCFRGGDDTHNIELEKHIRGLIRCYEFLKKNFGKLF